MNIGGALKKIRSLKGFSLQEVSALCNLSISYLSLLERGKRDPNISILETFCKKLKIPFILLIFLATEEKELAYLDTPTIDRLKILSYTILNLD